jgi:hypothetical protein
VEVLATAAAAAGSADGGYRLLSIGLDSGSHEPGSDQLAHPGIGSSLMIFSCPLVSSSLIYRKSLEFDVA